jgi:hypothetical protein
MFVVIATVVILVAGRGGATYAESETPNSTFACSLALGGNFFFHLADAYGLTCFDRADVVRGRLVRAFAVAPSFQAVPDRVWVGRRYGQPVVMVGQVMLVTVTYADAARNNMTPEALAVVWANRTRRALADMVRG